AARAGRKIAGRGTRGATGPPRAAAGYPAGRRDPRQPHGGVAAPLAVCPGGGHAAGRRRGGPAVPGLPAPHPLRPPPEPPAPSPPAPFATVAAAREPLAYMRPQVPVLESRLVQSAALRQLGPGDVPADADALT